MRILIVDDEMPARSELRYVLESLVSEAVFCEAADGQQALDLLEQEPIDALFLDINMPGLDGLAVAATIMDGPQPPLIVFATAYDEHALRAFELSALDYVLKPFDERRLAHTVVRLRQALAERALLDQRQAALRNFLVGAVPAAGLTKLWAQRDNDRRVLLDYHTIMAVEAGEKRVYVLTAAGEKMAVHHTLKELEKRFRPHNFVQVHKGYLVNLDFVAEVQPWFSGTYVIRLTDPAGTRIPMSRRYAAQLKSATGWE
jgi:DNA-binding LytR/AlgR family response regulator